MVILTQSFWKTLGCEEKEYKIKKNIWNPTKAAIAIWYYKNYKKGQTKEFSLLIMQLNKS